MTLLKNYLLGLLFFPTLLLSQEIVNVYVWGGEIPSVLIKKFERETKIKVNFSTFESNEALYAKLKTHSDFDVILPSSYILKKLIQSNKLQTLDLKKIPNNKNIDPNFLGATYDPSNRFSLPFTWGVTGIFSNTKHFKTPRHWKELWDPKYKETLLLMDDPREVFAIALLSLGYSPNDPDLTHIKKAYELLVKLKNNIKLITSNTVQALIIDEDMLIGMTWNSDLIKINEENKNISLHYPNEGFALWVDCLSILKNAPHKKEAYQFINFLLNNTNAITAQSVEKIPNTNLHAGKLLTQSPQGKTSSLIKKGILLADIGPKATQKLIEYWQKFKMII